MKRLITYLYNYEGGTKGKGTGFIRVDQRGREIRMEVHVRDAKHMQGKAMLYLIAGKDPVVGIYVGDIMMARGEGDGNFRFSAVRMFNSDMDFSDVYGVAVQNSEGYLASNWREESCPELLKGTFLVKGTVSKEPSGEETFPNILMSEESGLEILNSKTMKPKIIKPETIQSEAIQAETIKPEAINQEIINIEKMSMEGINMEETNSIETSFPEISSEEQSVIHMTQQAFEKPIYRKIQLSHIRSLPPRNRHLGNNNFLRHGFFNYNYLILKKEITPEGEQWSLGVPGVYEQPEKILACMFGFPRFESQEEGEDENPKDGTIGAWFTQLQM